MLSLKEHPRRRRRFFVGVVVGYSSTPVRSPCPATVRFCYCPPAHHVPCTRCPPSSLFGHLPLSQSHRLFFMSPFCMQCAHTMWNVVAVEALSHNLSKAAASARLSASCTGTFASSLLSSTSMHLSECNTSPFISPCSSISPSTSAYTSTHGTVPGVDAGI